MQFELVILPHLELFGAPHSCRYLQINLLIGSSGGGAEFHKTHRNCLVSGAFPLCCSN